MKINRLQIPAMPRSIGKRAAQSALVVALAIAATLPSAPPALAQTYSVDAAAARCRAFTSSVRNLRELSDRQDVLNAVRICIDLGIDPPLKARNQYGRAPSTSVATSQIPGQTCPPFATCLYGARVNSAAENPLALNSGSGNTINNSTAPSVYNAPQFTGHLPDTIPDHLQNGGTIYFYGSDVDITAPADSLLYPDSGTNFYADGGNEQISNGHVMTPPAPNGDIMAQEPVTTKQQVQFNFDDGGIIVLPDGFTGTINGQQVRGGEPIIIEHGGDILVPAGTKLYTFPSGTNSDGVHAHEADNPDYTGPPIKVPDGVHVENVGDPGVATWWTAP